MIQPIWILKTIHIQIFISLSLYSNLYINNAITIVVFIMDVQNTIIVIIKVIHMVPDTQSYHCLVTV